MLTVTDDGPGMTPEVVERVFEPFFSTKPKGEGTGLGLSSVYGIVQQNGGDVRIDSTPGAGTTVRVVLPGSTEGATSVSGTEPAHGGGSERILLVEDEQALREGTSRLLQARGYSVLTAADGVEALEVMDREDQPIDVVVTDVAMPRHARGRSCPPAGADPPAAACPLRLRIRLGRIRAARTAPAQARHRARSARRRSVSCSMAERADVVERGEETEATVRVLVVDDHRMFAESLARLLGDEDGIEVIGVAASSEEGVGAVQRLKPDVVLVDYRMPDRDGVETAATIKELDPSCMVVMLTGSEDDRVLLGAIDAGCSGFLTKDRAAGEVARAVRAAASGEALISPAQLARLLPRLSSKKTEVGTDLTRRELELLTHLARGSSNKAIAADLHLSLNTVRNYVQSVLTKLDAHSKLEAVATAVREGIIDYPSAG